MRAEKSKQRLDFKRSRQALSAPTSLGATCSPDSIYPIPGLFGDTNSFGVNLFTGDVNLTFPLATITDGSLSYTLSLIYNSKSAACNATAYGSVMNGNGWKLLDYPKIIADGGNLFFLDGYNAYPLAPSGNASNGGPAGYRIGGRYINWLVCITESDPTNASLWTIQDPNGVQYKFGAEIDFEDYSLWNLASMSDGVYPDSLLTFEYGMQSDQFLLLQIYNSEGIGIINGPGSGNACLSCIQQDMASGQLQTQFSYNDAGQLIQISQMMFTSGGVVPVNSPYTFSYSDIPGTTFSLLSSMMNPLGTSTGFRYYTGQNIMSGGTWIPNAFPVLTVSSSVDDDTYVYQSFFYSFDNFTLDATNTYTQWNVTRVYAGDIFGDGPDACIPDDNLGHTSYAMFNGNTDLQYYGWTGTPLTDYSVLGRVYYCAEYAPVTPQVAYPTAMTCSSTVTSIIDLDLPSGAQIVSFSCVVAATVSSGLFAPLQVSLINSANNPVTTAIFPIDGGGQTIEFIAGGLAGQNGIAVTALMPSAQSGTVTLQLSEMAVQYIIPAGNAPVPANNDVPLVFADSVGSAGPLGSAFSSVYPGQGEYTLVLSSPTAGTVDLELTMGFTCTTQTVQLSFSSGISVARFVVNEPGVITDIDVVSPPAGLYLIGGTVASNTTTANVMLTCQPFTDDALAPQLSSRSVQYTSQKLGPILSNLAVSTVASVVETKDGAETVSTSIGVTSQGNSFYMPSWISTSVSFPVQGGNPQVCTWKKGITYSTTSSAGAWSINQHTQPSGVTESFRPANGTAQTSQRVAALDSQGLQVTSVTQVNLTPSTTNAAPNVLSNISYSDHGAVTACQRGTLQAFANSQIVSWMSDNSGCDGNYTVAFFENADATQGEAGYYGFEPYENIACVQQNGGTIATSNPSAFTGSCCCVPQTQGGTLLVQAASPVIWNTTTPTYQLQAYVYLNAGGSVTLGLAGKVQSSTSTSVTWMLNQSISPTLPTGAWTLVTFNAASSPNAYPTIIVSNGAVDSFFYLPTDAKMTAKVWNGLSATQSAATVPQLAATIDGNGGVTRFHYGLTGALVAQSTAVATAGALGMPLSRLTLEAQSSTLQYLVNGTYYYSDTTPNLALEVAASQNAGIWDDFTSASNSVFQSIAAAKIGGHYLSPTSGYPASATPTLPAAQNFAIFMELLMSKGGQTSLILMGEANSVTVTISPKSISLSCTEAPFSLNQAPGRMNVMILVNNSGTSASVAVYLEGYLVLTGTAPFTVSSSGCEMNLLNQSLYNFGFAENPALTLTTYNAMGQLTQIVASLNNGQGVMASQYLYAGDANAYAGLTMPTLISTTGYVAPQPGFAELAIGTGANGQPIWSVSGAVTTSWLGTSLQNLPLLDSMRTAATPQAQPVAIGSGGDYCAANATALACSAGWDGNDSDFSGLTMVQSTVSNAAAGSFTTLSNTAGMTFGYRAVDGTVPAGSPNAVRLVGLDYYPAGWPQSAYPPNAYGGQQSPDSTLATTMSYDAIGNLLSCTDPDRGALQAASDEDNMVRLLSRPSLNGSSLLYRNYDPFGHCVEKGVFSYSGAITDFQPPNGAPSPAGSEVSELEDPAFPSDGNDTVATAIYSYGTDFAGTKIPTGNPIGRMVQAWNGSGNYKYQYAYDLDGRVTLLSASLGNTGTPPTYTLAFQYNLRGQVTQIAGTGTIAAYSLCYSYDDIGRLLSVGNSANPTLYATYQYGNGGFTETLAPSSPSPVTRTYVLNENADLAVIQDPYFMETLEYRQNQGVLAQIAGINTAVSNGTSTTMTSVRYNYDGFGRMVGTATNSTAAAPSALSVSYDLNGNITGVTTSSAGQVGSSAYVYDPQGNQLTTISGSGPSMSFGYDPDGNVTSTNSLSIKYDPYFNLPAAITVGDSNTPNVTFAYDALGQKVLRTSTTGSTPTNTYYVRDLNGNVLLQIEDGVPVAIVSGARGMLARHSLGTQQQISFALTDHLNSARVVIGGEVNNSAITALLVQGNYNYLPYGLQSAGSNPVPAGSNFNYLFTGAEWDPDLNLYAYPARLYDPMAARFYAPDRARQYASPYAYAADPVSLCDRDGNQMSNLRKASVLLSATGITFFQMHMGWRFPTAADLWGWIKAAAVSQAPIVGVLYKTWVFAGLRTRDPYWDVVNAQMPAVLVDLAIVMPFSVMDIGLSNERSDSSWTYRQKWSQNDTSNLYFDTVMTGVFPVADSIGSFGYRRTQPKIGEHNAEAVSQVLKIVFAGPEGWFLDHARVWTFPEFTDVEAPSSWGTTMSNWAYSSAAAVAQMPAEEGYDLIAKGHGWNPKDLDTLFKIFHARMREAELGPFEWEFAPLNVNEMY